MRQVREILRLKYEQGLPHRAIARACGVGLGTVSEYCRRAQRAALTWPLPADLDDAQLEARLFSRVGDIVGVPRPLPDLAWIHQELKRPGVTLQRLHLEYVAQQPEGYRYSQFCRHYHDWARTLAPTMRQIHRAGEKAFVDFSGKRPVIYDVTTGEVLSVELFVGALGASSYVYAEACPSQDLAAWIGAHVRMLEFFGGAPAMFVPDNLRSGVTQACRYEPIINRTYLEFAQHYGAAVVPARAGHPRDEAVAEAYVLAAQRWTLLGSRPHRRAGARAPRATVAAPRPRACRAQAGGTPSRPINGAGRTGPAPAALVAALLASKPHPEQGYRACLGLMRLSKTHGPARMDAACARALHLGAPSYRTVQNILASGADRIALPDASAASPRLPVHPNIRGRAYYTGEETTPCLLTPPSTN